jgi:uncharacterized repeat protein (TIGR01451 family)
MSDARLRHPQTVLRWLLPLSIGLFLILSAPAVLAQAGTISGLVFQDFNNNGQFDTTGTLANSGSGSINTAVDVGVAGVTITAYNPAGALAGTVTSGAGGLYTLPVTGAGPFRIEFTNLPTGYRPGAVGPNNNSTVQFAGSGATNIDLGIIIPGEYCQDNPDLISPCYVFGGQNDPPNSGLPALVSFPYSAGSNVRGIANGYDQPLGHTVSIQANQIGTTWGLAWARSTRRVYAAAFYKRHSGFGPGADGTFNLAAANSDDPAAIYVINPDTNTVVNVFIVPSAQVNAHSLTGDWFTDNDNTGWDSVGKTSLGGVAISDDDTRLYVMSLQNRSLYALDATTGAVVAGPQPITTLPNCAAEDVRPFAVSFYRDAVYVGAVCSAQSTQSSAQLAAYIYSLNPTTLAINALVFSAPLTYPRGIANNNGTVPGIWRPWTSAFSRLPVPAGEIGNFYPQPMLTDIVFDNGNLVLGIRDRAGDQVGHFTPSNPGDPTLYVGVGVGDILRACGSPTAGWVLEGNGRCGGVGNAPQGTGLGPGGAEYYYNDGYGIPGEFINHDEMSLGGLAQVPGFPDIVSTSTNPYPFANPAAGEFEVFDGGLRWFGNATGNFTKAYRLFTSEQVPPTTTGKSNGLGDVVILCAAAPIEIGNRVWLDADRDGIQDAGETPLAGVRVELRAPNGDLLAFAITDANGNYYFSSGVGPGSASAVYGIAGLTFNTAGFQVVIPNGQAALNGLTLTATRARPDAIASDLNDNDGAPTAAGAAVTFSTGPAGDNNHTYDFGFLSSTGTLSLGNRVWIDTDNSGTQNAGEVGVDNVRVVLFQDANGDGVPDGLPIAETLTLGGGYYLFDNLAAGPYIVAIPSDNFAPGAPLAGFLSSTGPGQSATPNDDIDLDDNGIDVPNPAVSGVISGPVILTEAGEPINETDLGPQGSGSATNPNSNLTVDFGFIQPAANSLSLGNRVWIDTDNSGTQNGGEVGVANVRLSLYRDDNVDGVPDGPPIAVTVTDGSGYYLFTNLQEGSYIVGVDAANFAPGGPLFGSLSSTGPGQEANPNDDGDLNDNGLDNPNPINGGILSGTVTLNFGQEPTNETDLGSGTGGPSNENSNLTVDFGFTTPLAQAPTPIPGTPPALPGTPASPGQPGASGQAAAGAGSTVSQDGGPTLSKAVDNGFVGPGSRVTWTITVSNPNSFDLTDLTVVDTVPAQLLILDAVATGGTARVNGQTVTLTTNSLGPGASATVVITTRVRDGIVGVAIENPAVLGSLRASATVVVVAGLPALGETPWWRDLLLVTALALMLGVGGWAVMRHKGRSPA